MSLRINTNTDALNAHRQLQATSLAMSKSMEKLSSGLRINRAADDAAGLAISEKMRAQIRGVAQANRNAMDGISMVQSAEGALNEVHAILQRVRELAVQYNNGTLSTADKAAITAEIVQLSAECSRIVSQMTFNGINVLGSTSPITFQVGANTGETIILTGMNLGGTYFDSVFVGTFTTGADIDAIDASLSSIADARAGLGAIQNRLEHTIANLATYHENLATPTWRSR
jgi:flagellin